MKETIASVALLLLTILLLDPFDLVMLDMAHMAVLACIILVFGAYASFVMREGAADEREDIHRMRAGRMAYLAGAAVITLGIAVQSYRHALDPWLVAALVAMVLAKAGARVYSDRAQ